MLNDVGLIKRREDTVRRMHYYFSELFLCCYFLLIKVLFNFQVILRVKCVSSLSVLGLK